MKETECAYLAGIVDGEGNIGLVRRPPKPECGEISPTFLDYVKISNTDYRMLAWVKDKVGAGSIYAEARVKERCRKIYTWHISSEKSADFLAQVYPYLVVKKEQADVIFLFRKTFDKRRFCKRGLSSEIIALREFYCGEMVRLHNHVTHGAPIKAGPQTVEARKASQSNRSEAGKWVSF